MTSYILAFKEEDYKEAEIFLTEHMVENKGLGYPTIIARREGEIIGILSTIPIETHLIAGPIFVNLVNRAIVGRRLIEVYEHILQQAGVSFYNIGVKKEDTKWIQAIHKVPEQYKETHETTDTIWFRRTF